MLLLLLLALLWGGSQAQDPRFSLQVQKVVKVQEGLCVHVPCTLSYPQIGWRDDTPAFGYWFTAGSDSAIGRPVATNNQYREVQTVPPDRFQLIGDPKSQSCSLLIKEAQVEDTAMYFFRVERGRHVQYNFLRNQFYLQVTALTQKPEVFVPEVLESGRQVTLICVFNWAFEECPAPTFSWMGAAVSDQRSRPTSSYFSMLILTPRPQDHGTHLTCRVEFAGKSVSTEKTVQLNVAYAPKNLVISISRDNTSALEPQGNSPHLEVEKGQFLRLLCAVDSQPPATLSWALEDRILSWSHHRGPGTLEQHQLVLHGVKPGDSGCYTCRAENRLGSQSRTLDLSVQYAPENLKVMVLHKNRTVLENLGNGTSLPVLEGQSLHLLCVTHSNPPARLSWAQGGQTLNPSQPADPGILELPQIQMEHEGELTCRAQNSLGSQHVSLHLSVVYKGLVSKAFSNGTFLGTGIMTFLFLCLLLVMKILRKKQTQAGTPDQAGIPPRPRATRRSTILDYINVVPNSGPLAQNRKAKPSSPSQAPPPGSLDCKKNQKELHFVSHTSQGPRSFTQASESNNREELHYATLHFSDPRPRKPREPQDTYSDYADIKFH
ncbi:sialic acid-binding Ig-like lectin 10 isoform X4 [Canis lupus familiaris]|uniref:Ig-like domain-containing protein n=2 Tax=Canis lupus familiaris TaxID=9615 RepID=A0A8C0Q8S7_CANLF|nr:sialic acid-binding Ig-like lectin 10 isoform X4 [Canis lupus familiaris]XP_025279832.1 sialic acid-binding Ig-like lectin 10 isoform X4 [Canis lupus dingo]XP_038512025.1 sialic acid-binding Ig-like lectin 10 isoform X4 [Canis lupus familiaris]|eukprot:XP_013970436.1 sialic acid-binding Ig-like lectin 10 isoform X3 [Canis lupus familiaris]